MKLNDFNNLTNFGIEDPRMTTIGGVAFRHLDRLPRPGDKVTVEGIMITILEMDEHRITKVRVCRGTLEEEDVEDKDHFQVHDETSTTEDKNFSIDRFEPAEESKNPDSYPTKREIVSESEKQL
jgi:hypothetical protein